MQIWFCWDFSSPFPEPLFQRAVAPGNGFSIRLTPTPIQIQSCDTFSILYKVLCKLLPERPLSSLFRMRSSPKKRDSGNAIDSKSALTFMEGSVLSITDNTKNNSRAKDVGEG